MTADAFRSCWLNRLKLDGNDWRWAASAYIAQYPFISAEDVLPLLEFLLDDLPSRGGHSDSADYRCVAEAYGWTFRAARLRPLGYGVACIALRCMVDSTGLEPATFSMSRKRSNQLS